MAFPPVIERGDQEAIEIIGQVLFKLGAGERGLGNSLEKDAGFQTDSGWRSFGS
jgi:hypothetical protein